MFSGLVTIHLLHNYDFDQDITSKSTVNTSFFVQIDGPFQFSVMQHVGLHYVTIQRQVWQLAWYFIVIYDIGCIHQSTLAVNKIFYNQRQIKAF